VSKVQVMYESHSLNKRSKSQETEDLVGEIRNIDLLVSSVE
jgi:hypothetical protein